MKKKIAIILCLVLLVGCMILWQFRRVTYQNKEYGFSFRYPVTYEERPNEKALFFLRNKNSKIEISVTAKKVSQKYDKSLEELGKRYATNLSIYYEKGEVENLENKTITLSTKQQAQQVTTKISYTDEMAKEVAILIPLEDREITIIMVGTENAMDKNQKQIEEIIHSIQIDEKVR